MDSYLGGLASKSDASSSVGAEGVVLLFFIDPFFECLLSAPFCSSLASCRFGYLPLDEACFLGNAPRLPGCLILSSASLMDRLASLFIFFRRSDVIMKVSSSDSS